MPDDTGITSSWHGNVTLIEINRPQARNALDSAGVAALKAAFLAFENDDSARVAVLHGRGGTFCAGADLKEMAHGANYEAWAGNLSGMLGGALAKPLVGAVSGHAVAGGLGVALYCDLRIVEPQPFQWRRGECGEAGAANGGIPKIDVL